MGDEYLYDFHFHNHHQYQPHDDLDFDNLNQSLYNFDERFHDLNLDDQYLDDAAPTVP